MNRTGTQHRTITLLKNSVSLGDSGTGKSYIMTAMKETPPITPTLPTIGIEFFIFVFPDLKDPSASHKLHLWDTSGADKFLSITASYLKNVAHYTIFVDVNCYESFASVPKWIELIRENGYGNKSCPFIGTRSLMDKGTIDIVLVKGHLHGGDRVEVCRQDVIELGIKYGIDVIDLCSIDAADILKERLR